MSAVLEETLGVEEGADVVALLRQSALGSLVGEPRLDDRAAAAAPLLSRPLGLALGDTVGVGPMLPPNLVDDGPPRHAPSVRQRLDAGALQALGELEPCEADAIALRLEQAGANVRNPSAYVHRAVNNARRRVGGPVAAGANHLLDASALAALNELPPDAARAILDELTSKGAGVRNPSAYVVKAVGNARRGDQVGVPQPAGQAAASQGAYLGARATGRSKQQQSSLVVPRDASQSSTSSTTSWPLLKSDDADVQLDPKAAAALAALPGAQAAQILAELQRKRAAIRNPSAYVMRATANAHAGQVPKRLHHHHHHHHQHHQQLYVTLPLANRNQRQLAVVTFSRDNHIIPEALPHAKRA